MGLLGGEGREPKRVSADAEMKAPPPLLGIQGYKRFPLFIVDAESSRDCVSEEVSGALPSLISLMVSVDVKPYVLLLLVDASPAARQSVILIFIEPMSIFVFLSPSLFFFLPPVLFSQS